MSRPDTNHGDPMPDRLQRARRTGAALLIALLPATVARAQAGQAAAIPTPPQGAWPRIEARQGSYFAYAAPVGWNVTEGTNGVDVMNPGANEGLNFMWLEGSRGSVTPRDRIEWLFEGLAHKEPQIRASSEDELRKLTGEYFGYHFDLPRREREQARSRWQAWWYESGRARKKT